jgi:hypothetical protein
VGQDDDSKRFSMPGQEPPPSTTRVWLRFGEHDVELAQGETILGRSPKCQIVLDDPLVSRSHARLIVNRGTVTVEDLGSANGVLVNGERLARARVIGSGDRLIIGQQTFQLFMQVAALEPRRDVRFAARTLTGHPAVSPEARTGDSERTEATRKGDAFELLVGVVEKVLALGRGDEAERILASYLRNLLQTAKGRGDVDAELAERAATYAVRIAEATGKGTWVDYTFELYAIVKRPLPAPIIERLYESLRKLSPVSVNVFRQYLSVLKAVEPELGPADRFLMRRIEGIEALGALR